MLFAWANKKLEELAETIAPIGSDSSSLPNKFLAALTSNNEDLALSILRGAIQPDPSGEPVQPLDANNTIFNNTKGTKAIHVACQHCSLRVIQTLVNDYRVSIDTFDYQGNTGLHYAAASNHPQAVNVVKTLVSSYNATVTLRNMNNQSPYDVSGDTLVRQYLLPLQLQRETQDALDSGGPLPPGTDCSSHRLHASQQFAKNNAPPTAPPAVSAPPSLHNQQRRMIPNDGFHSSASDPNLQRKYGHTAVQPMSSLPPPPPAVGGGGGFTGGRVPTRSKYLAYDAVTGTTSSIPTAGYPPPNNIPQQTFNPANQQVFNPSNAPQQGFQPPAMSTQQQFQPPPMSNIVQQTNVPTRPPPMHMNSSPPVMTHPPPTMAQPTTITQPPPVMNQPPPAATPMGALPPPPQMNTFTPPSAVASTAASTAANVFSSPTPETASNVFSAPAQTPTQSPPMQSSPPESSPPVQSPTASNVFSTPPTASPPMQQSSNQPAANFFSPPPNTNVTDVFSSPPSNT